MFQIVRWMAENSKQNPAEQLSLVNLQGKGREQGFLYIVHFDSSFLIIS